MNQTLPCQQGFQPQRCHYLYPICKHGTDLHVLRNLVRFRQSRLGDPNYCGFTLLNGSSISLFFTTCLFFLAYLILHSIMGPGRDTQDVILLFAVFSARGELRVPWRTYSLCPRLPIAPLLLLHRSVICSDPSPSHLLREPSCPHLLPSSAII